MRVLITGGRDFADRDQVYDELDKLHADSPFEVLIEGGALGADRLARDWAKSRGVTVETFEADWSSEGKAAGPKRNQRMLDQGKPDICVAFAGGIGTADMVRRAKAARVYIEVIEKKTGCEHLDPTKWAHRKDEKGRTYAVCPNPVCGRFMGYVQEGGNL